jgi:hypothetical protein
LFQHLRDKSHYATPKPVIDTYHSDFDIIESKAPTVSGTGTVALSSTEVEYMAMGEVTKEVLWMLQLLEGLRVTVTTFGKYRSSEGGMTIFGDNEAALLLAKTTKHHDRTKHINIRYHFLREHVKAGRIVFTQS